MKTLSSLWISSIHILGFFQNFEMSHKNKLVQGWGGGKPNAYFGVQGWVGGSEMAVLGHTYFMDGPFM